jgi:hypothetical protein
MLRLAVILLTPVLLWADAQAELKARLAAAEAANVANLKKQAALEALIQKLSNSGSAATAAAVKDASKQATKSAESAQDVATANIDAIKQAAETAKYSAEVAGTQAEQLQSVLTSNYRSTVAIQFTTVLLFTLGFFGTWLIASRDRRWAKDDAQSKAEADKAILDQGKQIHTLVNSNLTEAKTRELSALQSNLLLLLAERGRHPANGGKADGIIQALKEQIAELSAQVADRAKQTAGAEKELKKDQKTDAGAEPSSKL